MAPVAATSESARLTYLTLAGVLDFFSKIITRFSLSEGVVGPVALVGMVGGAAQAGIIVLLQFIVILSLSLAVINIMPIPALDGGHILILLIEKIKGRDLSHEAKNLVQFIGFASLIVLVLFITVRDLTGFTLLEYLKRVF